MAKPEKLPPGPSYEPVTSWGQLVAWVVAIAVIVTCAGLALVLLL